MHYPESLEQSQTSWLPSAILLQPSLCQRPSSAQSSGIPWGSALADGGLTLLKGLWWPILIIIAIKVIKMVIERYANLRK